MLLEEKSNFFLDCNFGFLDDDDDDDGGDDDEDDEDDDDDDARGGLSREAAAPIGPSSLPLCPFRFFYN